MKGIFRSLWVLALCAVLLTASMGALAENVVVDGDLDLEGLTDPSEVVLDPVSPALETEALESVAEPASGNAKTGESGGFTYEVLQDGTASITGCSLEGNVVIPDTIDGYTVTNLKRELFYGNGYVTSVTVPATVTYFGDDPSDSTFCYVFSYCFNLKSIKVMAGNPSFVSVNGVLFSKDKKVLYNYPCNHAGSEYKVPAKTQILDCTSFAAAQNLTSLYLESKDTIWMTYTFYADGNLTVYYKPGGYSQSRAEDFISSGLCREKDEAFPTFAVYPTEDPDEPEPTGVTISQGKNATLYMGNKLTLKAKVKPSDADQTVKWSSDNTKVATVSGKGVVTPKKAGTARITVTTVNGLSAKITVKVVDASGVKLKKGSTTLKKGQKINLKQGKSLTLKAVVSPGKVKTKLTWNSSNEFVTVKSGKVTVDKNAKVGAKAKITVETANGKSTYVYIVVK